jgi:hypothetical protein
MAKRASFFCNSFGLFKQTVSESVEDKAPQLGAGLAYYTVFSLETARPRVARERRSTGRRSGGWCARRAPITTITLDSIELGWPCISFQSQATKRMPTRRESSNRPLMTAAQKSFKYYSHSSSRNRVSGIVEPAKVSSNSAGASPGTYRRVID